MKTSKIIAFTACGVALVSLVSVGFATWFVGVQQKNQDVTMNLTVDTIENNTYFLTAKLAADEVKIGENVKVDKAEADDILGVGDGSAGIALDENAMKFTFSEISLKLGKSSGGGTTVTKPSKVTISLTNVKNSSGDGTNYKEVGAGGNKLGNKDDDSKYRPDLSENEKWTYLAFEKTLSIGTDLILDGDAEDSETYETYVLSGGTLACELAWGTFFGSEKPSTYYNGLFEGETDIKKLTSGALNVATELSNMSTALSGKNLTLTVAVK